MIAIERRETAGPGAVLFAYLIALVLGFAVSALLVAAGGADPLECFAALWEGAFGTGEAILQSLVAAVPLVFTGLGTVIAFRAGIWNVGQEGQMLAGAMAGYWVTLHLTGVSPWIALPVVVVAAGIGGGGLAGLCGWLRTRFGVNEIISTMMTNYLVTYLLSYLLSGGAWIEAGTTAYHQTPLLAENFHLPLFDEATRLHLGAPVALLAVALCWFVIRRTPLGYELRGLGANPEALRYKGVNIARAVVLAMCVSGVLSAMAGVTEVFGVNFRLRADVISGLGNTGIIVGMIGALNPFGTLVAAVAFGALANGGVYMNVLSDIPSALVPAMQGVLLLFVLGAGVLTRYTLRFKGRAARVVAPHA